MCLMILAPPGDVQKRHRLQAVAQIPIFCKDLPLSTGLP
jgi:hypothetical protein